LGDASVEFIWRIELETIRKCMSYVFVEAARYMTLEPNIKHFDIINISIGKVFS